MLTKMPKVGDVLIANDVAERDLYDITSGKEYTIESADRGGTAFYIDDAGDDSSLSEDYFEYFTLKNASPIGHIEIESEDFRGDHSRLILRVDEIGLNTILDLELNSEKDRKRQRIQSRIDALQAELNAL